MQNLEKEFLESGGEFENIALKELFVIKGNPQLNKDSFTFSESGEYPYFTRTVLNNGIAGYVEYLDDEHKIAGNCLAVGMLGMQFFYMQKDFYAGQFTKSAYPIKNKISKFNKNIAQYFIVLLNRYQKVFQGMLVRDFEKTFYESEVCIPMRDDKVDLTYIEQYMRELQKERLRELQKERLRELQLYLNITGLSSYELTDDEINVLGGGKKDWKAFNIVDIFDVKNTHSILSSWIVPNSGNIPYVTASESNNAISTYIDYDMTQIEKGNSIMIGGKTLVITYQEKDYFSNDSHNLALYLKDENGLLKKTQLFLVACLYKSLKPLYSWGNSISKKKIANDTVLLPINENNQIDFDYMTTFIKAVQKLIIKDLVLYTERELKAYEQVIG